MKQALALEIMLSGESVFLTGAAGSGKTYTLNQFIALSKKSDKKVSVTASTGIAATHLGGTTIHSWAGIGVADELANNFIDRMPKSRRETIEKTDILVIDEVSMLHDFRLDMVDEVCRIVRKQPDVPFGGIQVVMSGDFFQLPPINRGDSRAGGFVVYSAAWQELNPVVCYLEEQHRQDDNELLEILQAIRGGDVRRRHAEQLLARVDEQPGYGDDMTELYTTNVDVDRINEEKLTALHGDERRYARVTTGSANYIENLQRSVLAPAELRLKKGALVMAVKNAANRAYVNGSIGVVLDFEPGTEYPIIEFRNGKVTTMLPESWELRDGETKRASISQVPLRLAWAITIHKSQGMTLDAATIDLRKAFTPGMGYVALSRVKNLRNLYLHGINNMSLRISDDAQSIHDVLVKKSRGDTSRFSHLEGKNSAQKIERKKPSKRASSWNDKIAKMRETYPNAYRPWTHEQDEQLKQSFQQGSDVKTLSTELGRHEGSIIKRLQKHFGEDVVQ